MLTPPKRWMNKTSLPKQSSSGSRSQVPQLSWFDPVRGLTLMAILLNHFVEEFGSAPWFTYPSSDWPDFTMRMSRLFPRDYSSWAISSLQFLGWLGDSAPGVFILLSGFGLTWGLSYRSGKEPMDFYKRRGIKIFPPYIAAHFFILAGALFIPGNHLTMASFRTVLSLFGLRLTEGLFFYINPSWWFVWLILQLYLIFPLLYNLLKRVGWKWFLGITFAFTLVCRLYGLMYSDGLFYWMAGIFFGTRLAEFTTGMVVATFLITFRKTENKTPNMTHILGWSSVSYFVGLLCSFTWAGSLVSNLLVTIGMAGILFVLWQGFLSKIGFIARGICWIGVQSYLIYLLHQTPLKWTGVLFQGNWHLFSACLVLILSFPSGWLLNQLIKKMERYIRCLSEARRPRQISLISAICILISMTTIAPHLSGVLQQRTYALLVALAAFALLVFEFKGPVEQHTVRFIRWSGIFSAFFYLVCSEPRVVMFIPPAGLLVAVFALLAHRLFKSKVRAWAMGIASALLMLCVVELVLVFYFPLEIGKWGELPALQIHATRTYSLKPNNVTRLKYNNYDYIVKTNSFGLASPEIPVERPTSDTLRILILGDAFSMPEGVNYEYSYPALLQKELKERLSPRVVQVINAGVTGYSFYEEYNQLKELGPIFKPDLVILQSFVTDYEWAHLSPEYRLWDSGLVPKHKSKITNFLKNLQIEEHLHRIYVFAMEKLTGESRSWRYDKSLLRFYIVGNSNYYKEERLFEIRNFLRKMKDLCAEINSNFIIYFVPAAIAVCNSSDLTYFPPEENLKNGSKYDLGRPFRTLEEIMKGTGVPVIDLAPYFIRQNQTGITYFKDSWHWNREGHRVAARAITDDLLSRRYLSY